VLCRKIAEMIGGLKSMRSFEMVDKT
jgi:hypothetical protein